MRGIRCRSAASRAEPALRAIASWPRAFVAGAQGRCRLPERGGVRPGYCPPCPTAGGRASCCTFTTWSAGSRGSGGAPMSCWPAPQAVAGRLRGLNPRVRRLPRSTRTRPPRHRRGRRATAPWSGSSGRIEPRKGPLDLARAAPAIRRCAPRRPHRGCRRRPVRRRPPITRAPCSSRVEVEHYRLERQRAGTDAPPRRARPPLTSGAVRHRAGRGDGRRHAGGGHRCRRPARGRARRRHRPARAARPSGRARRRG